MIKRTACILLLLSIAFTAAACLFSWKTDVPEHGVWYNEELDMTLSREEGIPSTWVIDDEQIEVEWRFYQDNHTFDLLRKSTDLDVVFHGDCKGMKKDCILVTDLSDGMRYVFALLPAEENGT
ncbi:MAG: hypothetical protein IJJ99_06145 [Oscillospiraceae bacterium]|nr:hypothetical protein [Oscillospiraceae bacterium]